MSLINYLENITDIENKIIIDQPVTWPNSIYNLINSSKDELKKYLLKKREIEKIRNRAKRPVNKYESKWNYIVDAVNYHLARQKIVGYHCTRLMEYEIDNILNNGLIPLSKDFANKRIQKAYKMGLISLDLKNKLLNKEEFIEESNRKGNVHLTHHTEALRQEGGFYNLFQLWGGEAMFTDFEDNKCLKKIGTPCIIIADVEYQDLNVLYISQRLISYYVGYSHFYNYKFDSEIPHKVEVVAIIEKDNKLFNQLTNCNNWDKKIT